MKINARPLNEGETFVCSMKKAKEMFKNTDVHLNFAYYTRDYGTFAETQDRYFVKKNITGRVVASMYMHSGYKSPILSFYVIGKNNFCDELRVEFEQKYLPEFYKLYQTMLKDDGLIINTKLMLVEYVNNELKLHETVLDKKQPKYFLKMRNVYEILYYKKQTESVFMAIYIIVDFAFCTPICLVHTW